VLLCADARHVCDARAWVRVLWLSPVCPTTTMVAEYDHIVPITGYRGTTELYYNDLYVTSQSRLLRLPDDIKSRAQCVMQNAVNPYMYCVQSQQNFGLSVSGVLDPRRELVPITLSVGRCVVVVCRCGIARVCGCACR
jgi:hypothetical protein